MDLSGICWPAYLSGARPRMKVVETITVESIPITVGRENDGRWWADIESMPGVMAYGDRPESAVVAVGALALRRAARFGRDRLSPVGRPDIV
jgi:hypothetical protein